MDHGHSALTLLEAYECGIKAASDSRGTLHCLGYIWAWKKGALEWV